MKKSEKSAFVAELTPFIGFPGSTTRFKARGKKAKQPNTETAEGKEKISRQIPLSVTSSNSEERGEIIWDAKR